MSVRVECDKVRSVNMRAWQEGVTQLVSLLSFCISDLRLEKSKVQHYNKITSNSKDDTSPSYNWLFFSWQLVKLLKVTGNNQSRFLFNVGIVSIHTLWSVNLFVVFVHITGFEDSVHCSHSSWNTTVQDWTISKVHVCFDLPILLYPAWTRRGTYLGCCSQEGRSSELRLRRGVGQAAHTLINHQAECTGVLLCVSRE